MDSRPKRTVRLSCFDAWRSASSRSDGPRSIVSDATSAAISSAMVSVIARLPKRTAQCCAQARQKLHRMTTSNSPASTGAPSRAWSSSTDAVAPRSQLVFHLHRFDDHDRLARADGFTRRDAHAHDLAGHRRHEALRSRSRGRIVVLAAPASGFKRHRTRDPADPRRSGSPSRHPARCRRRTMAPVSTIKESERATLFPAVPPRRWRAASTCRVRPSTDTTNRPPCVQGRPGGSGRSPRLRTALRTPVTILQSLPYRDFL